MNKKQLYESIIRSVAKQVKKALNESTLNEALTENDIHNMLRPICDGYGLDAKIDGDTVHVWLCWHSNMDADLYDVIMPASGWLEIFAEKNDLEYFDGDEDFDDAYDIVWRVEIPCESFEECYEDLKNTAKRINDEIEAGYEDLYNDDDDEYDDNDEYEDDDEEIDESLNESEMIDEPVWGVEDYDLEADEEGKISVTISSFYAGGRESDEATFSLEMISDMDDYWVVKATCTDSEMRRFVKGDEFEFDLYKDTSIWDLESEVERAAEENDF